MKITNNFNLPPEVYNAVSKIYPIDPNRMSVTALIDAPLIRQLKIKHWNELQEDASARLWALLGQGIHAVLDRQETGAITEKKLEVDIDGITVVGKTDNYKDGIITDWKVTSVWHHIFSDNKSETAQANCYAWLWRKHNHPVKKLIIYRILRDWQQSKVGNDYPPIPFVQLEVPLWSFNEQEQYIKERLEYHAMSRFPECSPEDKWEKPTTFRVEKVGRKSALRVLDSRREAEEWCAVNGYVLGEYDANENSKTYGDTIGCHLDPKISIVERPGECVRCLNYCPVRSKCPYAKT